MQRRTFLQRAGAASGAALMFHIVPSRVLGRQAPSEQINVGMIGVGRQAVSVNVPGFARLPDCRIVAINDVDTWRMAQAEKTIRQGYAKQNRPAGPLKTYGDYRELIADPDVDAVMVTTPDHWHAPATIAAALAGKHVSMEKAFSVAPLHGKAVVEAVKAKGVANRLDSEFRSLPAFRRAVALVHNGVLGELTRVVVGVPEELNGSAIGPQPVMPIPPELNYDMWLGTAFPAPYTEKRVHEPKVHVSRPGWLRIKDYCNGMVTNWGAHLNDIALWGLRREHELPRTVAGTGTYDRGLWNTLNRFEITYTYADGLELLYKIDQPYVQFFGPEGWIKVQYKDTLTASKTELLAFQPGPNDVSYDDTLADKADFIHSIRTGRPTLEPLAVGYNVYLLTMMGAIAVELGQSLTWDPQAERFAGNAAADALLTRPLRTKWLDRNVVDWMNRTQDLYTL